MYMWYVTMLCVRMYVHVVCVYVVKFYKIIIVNCIKWDKRKQTPSVIDVQEHRKKIQKVDFNLCRMPQNTKRKEDTGKAVELASQSIFCRKER